MDEKKEELSKEDERLEKSPLKLFQESITIHSGMISNRAKFFKEYPEKIKNLLS